MTLSEANKYLLLTDEEISELLLLEEKINKSKELSQLVEDAYREIYIDGQTTTPSVYQKYDSLVEDNAFKGLFYIFAGIKNLEWLVEFYTSHGISLDIMTHTLQDTALWLRNYKKTNGCLGLASKAWIAVGFSGKLFRLGRMQFEMTTIKEDVNLPSLKKGDPALEGHVPQGEPLDHDACLESYRAAFPFFEKYFNFSAKAVHLSTWMLDPVLNEIFPPTSNVLKWQADATILPETKTAPDLLRFIFGHPTIDLKTAPRDTTMRKRIIEHMESGGEFHNYCGIIMREKLMNS